MCHAGVIGLFVQVFGHQVAFVFDEAAAAVEFDGGVAVTDLQVKELGLVFAGHGFGKLKKLRADSLSPMSCLNKKAHQSTRLCRDIRG